MISYRKSKKSDIEASLSQTMTEIWERLRGRIRDIRRLTACWNSRYLAA